MKKRMIFIFCTLFPTILIAEFFGFNSVVVSSLAAGIYSGISVALFPSPEFIEKLTDERKK